MQNQTRTFLRIHQQKASAEDLLDIIGQRNETWKSCRRGKNICTDDMKSLEEKLEYT